jgi:hypothetical protein
MAIKMYIIRVLMSLSTVVALVTEYLCFEVLVNEDLSRVYCDRKVSVILQIPLSQKLRAFMHISKLWICIVCCMAYG